MAKQNSGTYTTLLTAPSEDLTTIDRETPTTSASSKTSLSTPQDSTCLRRPTPMQQSSNPPLLILPPHQKPNLTSLQHLQHQSPFPPSPTQYPLRSLLTCQPTSLTLMISPTLQNIPTPILSTPSRAPPPLLLPQHPCDPSRSKTHRIISTRSLLLEKFLQSSNGPRQLYRTKARYIPSHQHVKPHYVGVRGFLENNSTYQWTISSRERPEFMRIQYLLAKPLEAAEIKAYGSSWPGKEESIATKCLEKNNGPSTYVSSNSWIESESATDASSWASANPSNTTLINDEPSSCSSTPSPSMKMDHSLFHASLMQQYPRQAFHHRKLKEATNIEMLKEVHRLRRHLYLMTMRETVTHSLQHNTEHQLLLNMAFPLPRKLQQEMFLIDSSLRHNPTRAMMPLNYALTPKCSETLLHNTLDDPILDN